VIYCRKHDILGMFLEKNASEVENMLFEEWDWDVALDVRYEEGMEDGLKKKQEEIARTALAEGIPVETVQKITGLDMAAIEGL